MEELKKVYIVTEGCYSDYHIKAVFSTEKEAKEYTEQYGDEDVGIEEYCIDEPFERKGKVWMLILPDKADDFESYPCERMEKDLVFRDYSSVRFTIFAETRTKAIKIARERLSIVLANPMNYPLLGIECMINTFFNHKQFPKYNFKTQKIVKEKSVEIMEKYKHFAPYLCEKELENKKEQYNRQKRTFYKVTSEGKIEELKNNK